MGKKEGGEMILLIFINVLAWGIAFGGVMSFFGGESNPIYLIQFIPTVGFILWATTTGLVEAIVQRREETAMRRSSR